MSEHPYKVLPEKAFWRRSVAKVDVNKVDPVGLFDLKLEKSTKVATAGSCFAQHISRHLQNRGFNYYVTESGHPIFPAAIKEKHNYGLFSARYGNIYTARQLLQLAERACGDFHPIEDIWIEDDGVVLDPFRPTVQPGGFKSELEMRCDRNQHLKAVRKMFKTLDVFVFTLGLTECWVSKMDGAVFPLCPGVEGGKFDGNRHEFYNQSAIDVINDIKAFIDILYGLNKHANIILTVSPVPLMATAEPGQNVLSATTYSKSVLRVAAETLTKMYQQVHYFPSYEVITGSYNKGAYYAKDLRNVTEAGVSHVMGLFLKHAVSNSAYTKPNQDDENIFKDNSNDFIAEVEEFIEVECDEIALDKE